MNVTAEGEADFNKWYDEEHLPALAAVPGVLAARRYISVPTTERVSPTFLAKEAKASLAHSLSRYSLTALKSGPPTSTACVTAMLPVRNATRRSTPGISMLSRTVASPDGSRAMRRSVRAANPP